MFLEQLERLKKTLKFLRTLLCGIKLFNSVLGKASCIRKKKTKQKKTENLQQLNTMLFFCLSNVLLSKKKIL